MGYVSQSPEYDRVRGLLQKSLAVDEIVRQWPQSQVDACLEDISKNVMFVPSINVLQHKSQRQHQQSFCDNVQVTIVETDAGNFIFKRDMNDEKERCMTYLHKNWPRNFPDPFPELANSGFFYTGVDDTIECIGCKGRINSWGKGENAIKEHNRFYPHCKFARASDRRNVPHHDFMNENQEDTKGALKGQGGTLLLSSNDVSRSENELELHRTHTHGFAQGRPIHPSQMDTSSELTDFLTEYSKYPDMVFEEGRLETYRQWPNSHCQIPENLGRAGFIAIGEEDALQSHVQQHMSASALGQAEEMARNRVMKLAQTRKRPYENSESLPAVMLHEKTAEKYTEGACALPCNLEGAARPPENGYRCWEEDRNETSSEKNTENVLGPDTDLVFKDVLMKLAEYFTKADINRLCALFDFSSSTNFRILKNPEPAKTFLLHLWRSEIIKSDDIVSLHDALSQLKMLEATRKLKELHKGMKQAHEDTLEEEMEKLREKYLCKICCHKIVKILFLPCLHLLCCRVCAFRVEKCPVCRKVIYDRISVIFHDLLKS